MREGGGAEPSPGPLDASSERSHENNYQRELIINHRTLSESDKLVPES